MDTLANSDIPIEYHGYAEIRHAWEQPVSDRAGALYLAFTQLREHYASLQLQEQRLLDTRVRKTGALSASLTRIIREIEHVIEFYVLPMLDVPRRPLVFGATSPDLPGLGPDLSSGLVPDLPSDWRRMLTNLWKAPLTLGSTTYPSAEHAYQAAKMSYTDRPELARMFVPGGGAGDHPIRARAYGTLEMYTKMTIELRVGEWVRHRKTVQYQIFQARATQHHGFRRILHAIVTYHVQPILWDPRGASSYWGGLVRDGQVLGANHFGKLLLQIAIELSSDSLDNRHEE